MKVNRDALLPPGLSPTLERKWFLVSLNAAWVLSAVIFQFRYSNARAPLFRASSYGGKTVRTVIPGTVIEDLGEVLHFVFAPLILLMLGMLLLALGHYLYYRQGSMSIYLMRRLPDRTLLHRQCLTLPLVGLLLCAAVVLALIFIYSAIYIYATPAQCLPALYRRF